MIEVRAFGGPENMHIHFKAEEYSYSTGGALPARMPCLLQEDLWERVLRRKYHKCIATPMVIGMAELECNIFIREALDRCDLYWDRELACWRYILGAPFRCPFPGELGDDIGDRIILWSRV
jgi:hypothetical protein